MSVVSKAKEQEKEVLFDVPLQKPELESPPIKFGIFGVSKALPTGEGDMLANEIEQRVGPWINKGYKIVEGSVYWGEGPNYWQVAFILAKYD